MATCGLLSTFLKYVKTLRNDQRLVRFRFVRPSMEHAPSITQLTLSVQSSAKLTDAKPHHHPAHGSQLSLDAGNGSHRECPCCERLRASIETTEHRSPKMIGPPWLLNLTTHGSCHTLEAFSTISSTLHCAIEGPRTMYTGPPEGIGGPSRPVSFSTPLRLAGG